jgi:C-terminal processing protease CtpA/Prc
LIRHNRLFITNNYSTDSTISLFAEIVSLNGIATPDLLDQLRSYVSAELDHYRDIRVQRSFRSLLWNVLGFEGDYKLELVGNGQASMRNVKGITAKEFQSIAKTLQSNVPDKTYTVQLTSEKIAVIDFRSMMDKKRFEKFLDSAFRVIKNERIEHLVIDIRNNGGGNSQLGDMLFNYITDKPYRQVDRMEVKASKEMKTYFRKQHLKWYMYPAVPLAAFHKKARPYFFGKPGKIQMVEMQKLQTPKNEKLKFKGSTYLLTSHYTFSSANMLANAFKCYGMGTIVGEEPGGVLIAFGDIIPLVLPNTKLTAWCSYKKFVHPCADDQVHGVKPDVEIIPTPEDIVAGRDAVMEYVKKFISKE